MRVDIRTEEDHRAPLSILPFTVELSPLTPDQLNIDAVVAFPWDRVGMPRYALALFVAQQIKIKANRPARRGQQHLGVPRPLSPRNPSQPIVQFGFHTGIVPHRVLWLYSVDNEVHMAVIQISAGGFSPRLLALIQLRAWERVIDALENGASPHVLVLPEMNFFETFLRHLSKPSLFNEPERIDEEIMQKRVFYAFLTSWRGNDPSHRTPLTLTTLMGRPDLTEALLGADHDPNEVGGGHTPLTALAMPDPELPMTYKLLRKFMDTEWDYTVRPGQMSCLRLLLDAGANINACSYYGRTALELACMAKNSTYVIDLLNSGADPEGQTSEPFISPLEIAVDGHCERAVDALIRAGANPLRQWGQKPHTHLPIATAVCAEGTSSMVKSIASKLGIDHPAIQAGWWLALDHGRTRIVDWFIDQGQDINTRDQSGATPLHHAVRSGQRTLIDRLVALGLDFSATNNEGVNCREEFSRHHPVLAREVLGRRVGEPGNVIPWRPRGKRA